MTITAAELRRQQRQLRRERERDARKADRARLKELRTNIRSAKVNGRARVREVVQICRTGRELVREVAREIRARKRAEAIAEIAAARAQSRGSCESRKLEARERTRDSLERAAAALAAEREHQALLARWAGAAPKTGAQRRRSSSSALERAAESDDEVIANLPRELVPVFRKVRARIKNSPRRTRTEAFLEWAQSHPADVIAITDAQLQDDVRRLVAEEKRLRREVSKPATYRQASEAELLRRYQSYSGAPDVPF